MTQRNVYTPQLSMMKKAEIHAVARRRLKQVMEVASIRLIAKITRIPRSTLIRWQEGNEVDFKTAAWFIVCFETDIRLQDLADRPVIQGRRATNRLIKE